MAEALRQCPASLLQAAAQLMAESGYVAMSMRQLASRVGLLPGSLYHHVACKQDLLLNVLLDVVERRIDAWHNGAYANDLNGFIRFMLRRQRSHPHESLLLRHEARHLDGRQRRWLDQALGRLSLPLTHIIQAAQPRLPDPQRTCLAMLTVIDAAGGMRHEPGHCDESWVEARVLAMCRALLQPCAV